MKNWLLDAAERVIATYVQAFLGLVIAAGLDAISLGTIRAAAVAAIPAALSVVKAIIAAKVGSPHDASLLPEADSDPDGP